MRPLPSSQPRTATSVPPVGAQPVVDPDGHLAGEGGGQVAGQPGIVEGHGAEHHPAHPTGQQLADVLLGTHAPTRLDRDAGRRRRWPAPSGG